VPLPVSSPPTQLEVWDTMWNQMAVHYPFFCIRGVNWFAVDALYRPQITADTTDDQLFALITSALSLFNDAHLLLIDANTVKFGRLWTKLLLTLPSCQKKRRQGRSSYSFKAGTYLATFNLL